MLNKNVLPNLATTLSTGVALSLAIAIDAPKAGAVSLAISNPGFENPVLQDGRFSTNILPGWQLYDPLGLVPPNGSATDSSIGAFNPTSTPAYISNGVPEGKNGGFVYLTQTSGSGVVGISQTLSSNLTAGTNYKLSVNVGDPKDFSIFGIGGFPGYTVQLLAGGNVLAQDNNSLKITEGTFATSTVSYTALASDLNIGKPLEIRLLNLLQGNGRDVDFDNVKLDATTAIPEPTSAVGTLFIGAVGVVSLLKKKTAFSFSKRSKLNN
jgi:hapalindole H/12-epi-hapalindole U/12-epi-fischerindole U synthase